MTPFTDVGDFAAFAAELAAAAATETLPRFRTRAAVDNKLQSGFDPVTQADREAERAMELAAVKVSLANLRTFPCIQEKEPTGEIALRGAYFAISDGVLHLLDEETGEFAAAG